MMLKTENLIERFHAPGKKLLLLDYDGTLVNFKARPEEAVPGADILGILTRLGSRKDLDVVIISGRDSKDIDSMLGHLPVGLIAEHGSIIKKQNKWEHLIDDNGQWKSYLFSSLVEYTLKCPGSFVEEKEFSLCWHYRNCTEKMGNYYAAELVEELDLYLKKFNLKVLNGKKVLEFLPANTDKGRATMLLMQKKKYDCILTLGDDHTDEDIFKVLLPLENCITVKVGEGNTLAKHRIENVEEVISFLEKL